MTRRGRGGRKFARGRKAVGICDRSGFKYPLKDLVREPGTGLLVHKRESDGAYNRVDHPQNFPADTSEAIGLKNPRPDREDAQINFLRDDEGILILGPDNQPIFI